MAESIVLLLRWEVSYSYEERCRVGTRLMFGREVGRLHYMINAWAFENIVNVLQRPCIYHMPYIE